MASKHSFRKCALTAFLVVLATITVVLVAYAAYDYTLLSNRVHQLEVYFNQLIHQLKGG